MVANRCGWNRRALGLRVEALDHCGEMRGYQRLIVVIEYIEQIFELRSRAPQPDFRYFRHCAIFYEEEIFRSLSALSEN